MSMLMDMSSGSMVSLVMNSAMNMATATASSHPSATTSSMNTSTTITSSSSMSMSTGHTMSGHNMSGMDMSMGNSNSSSSMDMGMDMKMNYYLTRDFKDYPLLFKHLSADTKSKAFGIFVLLVVTAFIYKFLSFTSWCLEVHWFKKWNRQNKLATAESGRAASKNLENDDDFMSDDTYVIQTVPKLPNLVTDIFKPSFNDVSHDFVRILITFSSTMLIYMLMLAAMSFVLTYVFAIITGLAFSEVFFNRCKICLLKRWDIQRTIEKTKNCPGLGNCECGRHKGFKKNRTVNSITAISSNDANAINEYEGKTDGVLEKDCCCAPTSSQGLEHQEDCECSGDIIQEEQDIERNIMENITLQEQVGNMDVNLLPAEKFKGKV